MRWGLIPIWANDMKIGYCTINAWSEAVHQKPAFRTAFRKRRCLMRMAAWREEAALSNHDG